MTEPRYALAERVAWVDVLEEEAVYATALPDGPPLVLRGSARLIFLAVAAGGTLTQVVHDVAGEAGVPPEDVESDVVSFVRELAASRLVGHG